MILLAFAIAGWLAMRAAIFIAPARHFILVAKYYRRLNISLACVCYFENYRLRYESNASR